MRVRKHLLKKVLEDNIAHALTVSEMMRKLPFSVLNSVSINGVFKSH